MNSDTARRAISVPAAARHRHLHAGPLAFGERYCQQDGRRILGQLFGRTFENIAGRFTPGLKAVMQLQPLRYEYKPDNALGLKSSGEHIGFGAQAVQKIIPEAVSTNDKGYLLVNNDPILWTMLNAVKEQQRTIEGLKRETGRLKARNSEVVARLVALEATMKRARHHRVSRRR